MKKGTVILLMGLAVTACIGAPNAEAEKHLQVAVYVDSDRDGIPDYLDACPGVANTGNGDHDGDLLIDACDLDPAGNGRIRPVSRNR